MNQPKTPAQDVSDAEWRVGRFYSSYNPKIVVLCLAVGDQITFQEKHPSFIEWVYVHPERFGSASDRGQLYWQGRAIECGFIPVRSGNDEWAECTQEQALEFLSEVIGSGIIVTGDTE